MGNVKLLNVSTKMHPETFALVDEDVYEWLSKWKRHSNKAGYVANRKMGYLHRQIARCPSGFEVDHRNGNKLDNQRNNLRICNRSQNMGNQKKQPYGKSSRFKGVIWDKRAGKFIAQIKILGCHKYLGGFRDESEAAGAYNQAAIKYFGEFAKVNEI